MIEFVCGACNSLDEFTVYLTPAQLLDDDSLEGEFVGIGIQVQLKDQKLLISQVARTAPLPWPACRRTTRSSASASA